MISCAAINNESRAAFSPGSADRSWLADLTGGQVEFNVSMRRYTTFGVGGPADMLVKPTGTATLKAIVSGADHRSIPWLVVGGGSNLLVRDGGFKGIVIVLGGHFKGIEEGAPGATSVELSVKAGTRLATLCRYTIDRGIKGFGFASGIPGSVGGAMVMNAGTAAGSIQDVLTSISVLWPTGRIQRIEKKALNFDYRRMTLPGSDTSDRLHCGIIIEGVFTLERADAGQLELDAKKSNAARRKSQPLGVASAGCFFKNPSSGPSAGQLIDQAGLKGKQVGDAQVSMQHGNFIINRGRARATDILDLAEIIEKCIAAQFGIQLEREVIIVGESNHASKSV
jgi:UDP-N-acetylmuramate dehydrogenase